MLDGQELGLRLGADRVEEPLGALPQPARRLDSSGPVHPHEFEVAVEKLCLDATSFRNIRQRAAADPADMAAIIEDTVRSRGKMHNPETDSGGVALGTVTAVGERFQAPPATGDRVVTLASLTLTPLKLERVTHVDPDSAQVSVIGTAYVNDTAPWAVMPRDLPEKMALEVYDVYGAASHTLRLAQPGDTVYVLGCGHAGKLAMAAAKSAVGKAGTVVALDVDASAVARVRRLGLCDIGVVTDLRDPVGAAADLSGAGAPPSDLTVVVVSATGCEPSAIVLTKPGGTILFFSMATSFSTAALTADGMGKDITMLVGSGYTPDVGSIALDLVRTTPALRAAFEDEE